MAQDSDGAGFVLDDETRDTVFDQFRDRAAIECDDWRAAGHSFDHHKSEGLRPVDRNDQRDRAAKKFGLLSVSDLADVFDVRFGEQRSDHFFEIIVIDRVDFRCDLERQAAALGDVDGAVNPLFRGNAAQKSEIRRFRGHGPEEILRHSVVNRADPISIRRGPPLRI